MGRDVIVFTNEIRTQNEALSKELEECLKHITIFSEERYLVTKLSVVELGKGIRCWHDCKTHKKLCRDLIAVEKRCR